MKPLLDRLRELVTDDDAAGTGGAMWIPLRASDARALLAEIDRLNGKWQDYEQHYILPLFVWATELGFDLRQLVQDNPGKNCAQLFFEQVRSVLSGGAHT